MVRTQLKVFFCLFSVFAGQYFTYHDSESNSEEGASFLSQLFFNWLDFLFIKGFRGKIEYCEIPQLPSILNVQEIIQTFEKNYKVHYRGIKKIIIPLVSSFGLRFILGTILRAINDVLLFLGPLILRKILNVMESGKSLSEGYFWCILLLLNALTQSIISCQYFRAMYQAGFQMRTAVMSSIFKKSLKLSPAARQQYSAGEITNLLAIDAQRIVDVIPQEIVTTNIGLK